MLAEGAEVCRYKQQARGNERGEDSDESEVPKFVRVQRQASREMHESSKSGDQRKRGEGSIGGNGVVAELEQTRIQGDFYRKAKTDPLGRAAMRR